MKIYDKSRAWYTRAKGIIPWATQTGAKRPDNFPHLKDHMPYYIDRAKGARFWDLDGNEFIDYVAALGPIILGYACDEVDDAVRRQMVKGSLFSLASPLEYELAEALTKILPCAERVRFAKTGGDATCACVRLARAYTGRDKILSCGYHGWDDVFIAGSPGERRGIPASLWDLTINFDFNDLEGVRRVIHANPGQIAGIIVNPFTGVQSPAPGFLEGLRDLATAEGIVLIFDEVKTGFRIALGGAQELFGVVPDLAAYSKALANGYPISAFVGKREFMDILNEDPGRKENVKITTTFAGETLSIAAALATLKVLQRPETWKTLKQRGKAIMDGLTSRSLRHGLPSRVAGLETWFYFFIEGTLRDGKRAQDLFHRRLIEEGVFCLGEWNVSLAHGQREIDETLAAADKALESVKHEMA